jgi:CRP/FNR family cyclic AMP-dependent transcriptional regulator
MRDAAHALMARDGKPVSVIRDSGGFVTQRVVATIVNIASDMCQQAVCSPDDLETAVKLGLGYPMGPLEMGNLYGPTNVLEVLFNMQTVYGDPRYRPSPWLRRRGAIGLSLLHTEGLTARPSPSLRATIVAGLQSLKSPKGQAMDEPILTIEEREAINSGRWFSAPFPLHCKHDILRCAYVKRFKDGDLIAARGEPPEEWIACAKGAVRVSSTSISGKQITLTYVEPGIWFGDVSIFDGDRRTHDAYAHGDTTVPCVAKADFKKILALHVELYEALLRLHSRRIRQLYGLVEDLNTLPLRARLAKQLLHLVRSYGVASAERCQRNAHRLQLAQEELAQLLGASRQRVNQELKSMEREEIIRIEPGGLVDTQPPRADAHH